MMTPPLSSGRSTAFTFAGGAISATAIVCGNTGAACNPDTGSRLRHKNRPAITRRVVCRPVEILLGRMRGCKRCHRTDRWLRLTSLGGFLVFRELSLQVLVIRLPGNGLADPVNGLLMHAAHVVDLGQRVQYLRIFVT